MEVDSVFVFLMDRAMDVAEAEGDADEQAMHRAVGERGGDGGALVLHRRAWR